jgi:hypothetical protein
MTTTPQPVLDWHPPSADRKEANQPYRLGAQLEAASKPNALYKQRARGYSWVRKLWLDQGSEGACTGFALAHCLGIGNMRWDVSDTQARWLYKLAQQHDQWHGENYEGSSVQGAMEGAKAVGLITGYWWIESEAELKAALPYGALDAGTWWYSGMWKPDSNGYVHATGTREGGHSYEIGAVDLLRNRARIDNSWGKSKWGVNGSAWIDLDELCSLVFEQNGELALPRKKRPNPALFPVTGALSQ